MNESILKSVKQGLGVPEWDDGFDATLVIHINSALMTLSQLGVGPNGGVLITGPTETWASVVEGDTEFEMVKSYVILKVKLLFDPPSSSFVLDAINKQLAEFEWRLNVQAEGAFD